jgi:hypothetical protein
MSVPTEYQEKVDRLRRWLNDTTTLNVLTAAEESTDEYLYEALLDAIDEINNEWGFESSYALSSFPNFSLLKYGAALQILMGKGILSARNTLTYRDAGGIQISDLDTYARYMPIFNQVMQKWTSGMQKMIRKINVDGAYGGVGTEMEQGSWDSSDTWY